jgi:enterobactin synthetase component F
MVPVSLVALEAMPLTPHGKVDRAALPAPAPAAEAAPAETTGGGEVVDRIAAIFRRLLGDPSLAVDADFFDSGGDSLLAVELASEITSEVGTEVSVLSVFEARTPERLAKELAAAPQAGGAPKTFVEIRAGGSRLPIFCPHPGGGEVLAYFALGKRLDEDRPLLGIQSRGIGDPTREHATLPDLARAYADSIAERQPQGPIHLLGWSMGGVAAVAIAHELERRGRQIGFLGLVDAHLLGEGSALANNPFVRVAPEIGDVAGRLGSLSEEELRAIGQELLALAPPDRFAHAVRLARQRGLVGPEEQLSIDMRAVELGRRHAEMLAAYRLPVLDADIVYWKASESAPDAEGTWARATRGRLTELELVGNHYSVMAPPQVDALAAAVSSALREAGEAREL